MDRRRLLQLKLLAGFAVGLMFALLPFQVGLADGPECSEAERAYTDCPRVKGTVRTQDVEIFGSDGGSASDRDDREVDQEANPQGPVGEVIPPEDNCDFRCDDWSVTLLPDEDDDEDEPAVVVTIADVARFRPAIGGDHMEPNGWAVIGLPANFYARGGVSVKRGELFDRLALVRFTPVAWNWDYGDGGSRTTAQPGASWAALGVSEFDETATSHVFDEPGDFRIQLTISYSAEYQFAGSGWIPIDGLLPAASNPIEARAVTARTMLVSEDCNENPGGPGC